MPDQRDNLSRLERIAFLAVRWIGSAQSIIIHTLIFATVIAILLSNEFSFDTVILVFNTAVSLEAIYLALFIQLTVNHQGQSLREVEQDIDEIQEDVDEIQEDIDEIQEDVEEMQEDVEEMSEEDDDTRTLEQIHGGLQKLIADVERLQQKGS